MVDLVEKRGYTTFLRPIISGGLIFYIIWKVGPSSLGLAFASSRWGYIVLAALLSIVFIVMKTLRWDFMLRKGGVQCGIAASARSYLAGGGARRAGDE